VIGGSDSDHPDWAATALLYAGLHEVEAVLRERRVKPVRTHEDRKEQVRSLGTEVSGFYESLKRLSEDGRYHGYLPDQARLTMAELALRTLKTELAKLAPLSS
jgi:hypothetical protein